MTRPHPLSLLLPLALLSVPALRAQPAPLSLCIVQIRSAPSVHFDPSAGPWAAQLDAQLSGRTLRNGTPLALTVLAASLRKEVLPEARRLHCSWIVQLLDQHFDTFAGREGVSSSNPQTTLDPTEEVPGLMQTSESLFFALRKADTGRTFTQGALPLPPAASSNGPSAAASCVAIARQILDRLNRLP